MSVPVDAHPPAAAPEERGRREEAPRPTPPPRPAPQGPGWLSHALLAVTRPRRFWQRVELGEGPSGWLPLWPQLPALMLWAGAAAALAAAVHGESAATALQAGTLGALTVAVGVGVVASLLGLLALSTRASGIRHALGLSVWASTPCILLGALGTFAAVPLPIGELVAMPWAFYVLAEGVDVALDPPSRRRARVVALGNGLLLATWLAAPLLTSLLLDAWATRG